MSVFNDLTEEQRAAVLAEGSTVNVEAGPGSGKTRVLAARIAYLIERGENPESILALTFTRSACANIAAQVEKAVGERAARVRVMTFHGYAASLVLPGTGLRVASEAESEAALRSLYDGPMKRKGSRSISQVRQDLVWYEACDEDDGDESRAEIDVIASRLKSAGLMPTWSLIRRALSLSDSAEKAHVLVDEAQDTTFGEHLLYARIKACFEVEDRRQAIMCWRGAQTGSENHSHALSKSFRFGPSIAAVANKVADFFGGEHITGSDKNSVVSETSPRRIADHMNIGDSVAWLCRTHRDCEMVVRRLAGQCIPAVHIERDPTVAMTTDADLIGDCLAAGKVAVCTVHAAKGREFDAVVVDDSVLASCDANRASRCVTDEDFRVLYVAATRAKECLMLPAGAELMR